jgi:hypothetical protein
VRQRLVRAASRLAATSGRGTTGEHDRAVAASYVGVTRFSVLEPKGRAWKLSRNAADLDSYREQLWSPDRMRPRCEIFFSLSVPILQLMADRHDYRHIVRFSPRLPDPWRSQLLDAARRYPVLFLLESGKPARFDAAVRSLLRAADRPSRPVVQFRLDDDDLLAVDFLDRVAAYATPHDVGRAISMASGYAALYDSGTLGSVHAVRRVFGSQGLAYVGRYDARTDTLAVDAGGPHYNVDRRMPTLVDSREPAFFQMRHVGQDTLIDADEAVRTITRELEKREKVDDATPVAQRFPTLGGLLQA